MMERPTNNRLEYLSKYAVFEIDRVIASELLLARQQLEAYRWIPVEERLPELNKKVMVTNNFVDFGSGYLARSINYPNTRDSFETNFYHDSPVTHWMPLPVQPEEG